MEHSKEEAPGAPTCELAALSWGYVEVTLRWFGRKGHAPCCFLDGFLSYTRTANVMVTSVKDPLCGTVDLEMGGVIDPVLPIANRNTPLPVSC